MSTIIRSSNEPGGQPARRQADEKALPAVIAGYRRAEHSDLPRLEHLIRPTTREIFGDVGELGRLHETACLSVVQYNERRDVVSGICLCNYPNVPSVPPCDWLSWLETIYRIPGVTERNTMFVHLLVWDERYSEGHFLGDLLAALFDITTYCQHVILVVPPRVTPAHVFEREMTRVSAKGPARDTGDALQFLYLSARREKLNIRRAVEEDNDDVIPIIDNETTKLRELYGKYYISEMIRYPDGRRQLIIGEDADGLAAGAMCLDSACDVDLLNENFELAPYNGLRKSHGSDETSCDVHRAASELLRPVVSRASQEHAHRFDQRRSSDDTSQEFEDEESFETVGPNGGEGCREDSPARMKTIADRAATRVSFQRESERNARTFIDRTDAASEIVSTEPFETGRPTFFGDVPSVSDYFDTRYRPKTRTTVLADTMTVLPRRSALPAVKDDATRLIHDVHPTYRGEINVFVLEIFAMRDETRSHWSRDFLDAAFDCFPDLEYCVMLLPSSHPCYEFLQHFVRVPLRCDKDFPMTLYVVHRAIFHEVTRCRRADARDREAVEGLLSGVSTKRETLTDFDLATDPLQHDLDCFVFECNDAMLGLAVLRAEKQIDFVVSRYHVEDHVSLPSVPQDDYGRLLHFVLTPIFSAYHRFFFREIARLSGLTVMFYRLHHEDQRALTRKRSLVSCLRDMIPVNPRRQAEYRFLDISKNRENNTDDKTDDGNNDTFSLFMTSPRLAMMPRTIVDMKVVIVGASDCGIAFAECLALRSTQHHTQFTNVTLISPHGLPFDDEQNRAVSRLLPFRGTFCPEYRRCVAARTWINIVYGTVIAINRKGKYVTVMNQGSLAYDYLVLTCGLQYQRPMLQGETRARERGIISGSPTPWNCLTVNDDTEACICLRKISRLTRDVKERKRILFYGHNIDCYCALRGLIEFGVKPSWITLIEPKLNRCETHDKAFFYDCEVDKAATSAILQSGVEVLSEWNMIDWTLTENEDGKSVIDGVSIERRGETRTLACDALFNFHEKTINADAFLAFCHAGLVFDGLLVIDPECRTNDPFIFAAGTLTKYSRKFYADSWQHKYYNSVEVGERLAQILRRVIDIHRRDKEVPVLEKKEKMYLTLPVFRAPVMIACILPGDYHYLHVCKPGKKLSRKTAIDQDFYGEVLVTGSCTSEIGYFRIRLNPYDSVETVTCVSRKPFVVQKMVALYGKHESMLNELKHRFRTSSISDFYAYFRDSWAAAIFYDRFQCLRVENRATLLSRTGARGDSLVDDCVHALIKSKWEAMSEKDRHYIESRYAGSVYHQELESNLINFLEFYENDLPMYYTPSKQRQMYADIEKSPLYFEQ